MFFFQLDDVALHSRSQLCLKRDIIMFNLHYDSRISENSYAMLSKLDMTVEGMAYPLCFEDLDLDAKSYVSANVNNQC